MELVELVILVGRGVDDVIDDGTASMNTIYSIITSAEEGGYVFWCGLLLCLSVCLSVCPSDYSQTCERILTKFFGG